MNSLNDQAFLHSYNLKESEAAEMVNKVNYALTLHSWDWPKKKTPPNYFSPHGFLWSLEIS